MTDDAFNEDDMADSYWAQEMVNDRDEWDQHLQAVYEDEIDRMRRDVGER